MSATEKLLDKYAGTCYPRKDIDIAKALKVKKQTVSGWRNGKAHPDAESVERMARAIGEPVGPWLANIEAERARTPAGKQVWLRLAATLGTTLAVAITTLPVNAIESAGTLPIVSNCMWGKGRVGSRRPPMLGPTVPFPDWRPRPPCDAVFTAVVL